MCHRLRPPRKKMGPGCAQEDLKNESHERAPSGDGRSDPQTDLRTGKNKVWRDTGPMTQSGDHVLPSDVWDGLGPDWVGLRGELGRYERLEIAKLRKSSQGCARMTGSTTPLGTNRAPRAGSSLENNGTQRMTQATARLKNQNENRLWPSDLAQCVLARTTVVSDAG